MIKTVFTVLNGRVSSCMSIEWPENITQECVEIVAAERGESQHSTFALLVGGDVVEFCKDFSGMKTRAQINKEQGPFVVNSDEEPSKSQLLAFARQHKERSK